MGGFHIYIIKSDKQNFYIGQTKNLIDRLRRHNSNLIESTIVFTVEYFSTLD